MNKEEIELVERLIIQLIRQELEKDDWKTAEEIESIKRQLETP